MNAQKSKAFLEIENREDKCRSTEFCFTRVSSAVEILDMRGLGKSPELQVLAQSAQIKIKRADNSSIKFPVREVDF